MEENNEYSEVKSDIPSTQADKDGVEAVEQPEESTAQPEDDEEYGENHSGGITGTVLEGFSAEGNVERLTRITRLSKNTVTYIFAALYFVVGVLCVTITSHITSILPYLVGGVMVVLGLIRFIFALITHEYRHTKTNLTATSLIITALGAMILVQQLQPESSAAITFIAIVWGIWGLLEGAHALNHAFERIANSERCIFYLLKGIVELVVAFLLLYNPVNHETHHFHIIVFGINLIVDSITLIPQVKAFLATK